jgi:radical S-adenosyl methionine domain-containing protein 2
MIPFITAFVAIVIYACDQRKKNLVVNWHFQRKCNYACKFCFHTAKTSAIVSIDNAKKGLRELHEHGMTRINFSGGEPFLCARFLGKLCKWCKEDLGISVSIVSNGSKITKTWMDQYGQYLDALAISCDSFNEETLEKIGRFEKKKTHLKQLGNIATWCDEFGINFKINTVVCSVNKTEDMVKEIKALNPVRWKVFQCLLIDGENCGAGALKDAKEMTVTPEEFQCFISRHSTVKSLVPEDNSTMRNSYLILDEYMRFLNNTKNNKRPTKSILEAPVSECLNDSGFDAVKFKSRTGEWCTEELQW